MTDPADTRVHQTAAHEARPPSGGADAGARRPARPAVLPARAQAPPAAT